MRRVDHGRRALLAALVGMPVSSVIAQAAAPIGHGRIAPPLPVPDIEVRTHEGVVLPLREVFAGHVSAAHVFFTRCRSTCPIQGELFRQVQTLLSGQRGCGPPVRLVSISKDPQHDLPRALAAWRAQYHAGAEWLAVVPRAQDARKAEAFFGAERGGFDSHSTQVSIVDERARLVWRTQQLPAAEQVAVILRSFCG